ncbi:hypothetical protein PIB30_023581 [Stylosanthes scabra]|uniref:PB1-like domain-containing protein n=1 Tax=Stylosanthes scabra TaxID=79078 RepID=A0ABU6X979_9FABA|nr:hypothetical protein [Stylosanthes scabra]
MDVDFVNYGDMVKLLESIGYPKFKRLKWYDFTEDHLGLGLYLLAGDDDINHMCDHLLRHIDLSDEFYIYVEHEVDVIEPCFVMEISLVLLLLWSFNRFSTIQIEKIGVVFKDMNVRDTILECANKTTPTAFVKSTEKLKKINEDP